MRIMTLTTLTKARRVSLHLAAVLLSALVLSGFSGIAGVAFAAGSGGSYPRAPIDDSIESRQRGAALFVNYCLGCHSARYMSYGRMAEDLQITPQQMREHLIFADAADVGLGDGMMSAMSQEDGRAWFNDAVPPDLSLVARVRGEDWLYAYLRAFYRDDSRPGGWNNAVFANAAMPHVLAGLQGVFVLDDDGDFLRASEGRMTAAEYDKAMADLTGFLRYIAEPSRERRLRAGYLVMAGLMITLVASYFIYRDYWRDIT